MGIEKKVYSVRLDEEILSELRTIAKDENRTLSNLVETVLKKYVSSKNQQVLNDKK